MVDSVKTTFVGMTGMSVTWLEWMPVVVRILVGLATFVYLLVKIRKELKN
tara:strand:+ start:244 stop:393 length:150 start_codon:yes stop_codon:yes gene_type:complete